MVLEDNHTGIDQKEGKERQDLQTQQRDDVWNLTGINVILEIVTR